MSEKDVNVMVTVQKTKSSAPVILGVIGFVLGLPAVLCLTVCAAVTSGTSVVATEMAKQVARQGSVYDGQTAEAVKILQSGGDTASAVTSMLVFFVICWLAGFILSFFGKSKISATTGILLILCGGAMIVASVLSISFLGGAAAICYMIGGILSITNRKLAA